MNARSTIDALAAATHAVVGGRGDVAGLLTRLLVSGAEALEVDDAAVLALDRGTELTLLAAGSHRTGVLEALQAMHDSGPCVECIETDAWVSVDSGDAMVARWPVVGAAVAAAGFTAVDSFPVRWHGRVIAGLNLFRAGSEAPDPVASQAFADLVAIVLALDGDDPQGDAVQRAMSDALAARHRVELAKGVLAQRDGLDMGSAHGELVRRAEQQGQGLGAVADEVVRERGRS